MTTLAAGWWRYRLTAGRMNWAMRAGLIAPFVFILPPSIIRRQSIHDRLSPRLGAPETIHARSAHRAGRLWHIYELREYRIAVRAERVKSTTPSRVRDHQSGHWRGGGARSVRYGFWRALMMISGRRGVGAGRAAGRQKVASSGGQLTGDWPRVTRNTCRPLSTPWARRNHFTRIHCHSPLERSQRQQRSIITLICYTWWHR